MPGDMGVLEKLSLPQTERRSHADERGQCVDLPCRNRVLRVECVAKNLMDRVPIPCPNCRVPTMNAARKWGQKSGLMDRRRSHADDGVLCVPRIRVALGHSRALLVPPPLALYA